MATAPVSDVSGANDATVADRIRRLIETGLSPQRVDVIDESHRHAGHAGARAGGQSHFRLIVVSARFEGLSRVARQRLVNDILRDDLAGPVHALAMSTLTPLEAAADA